jgi:hypothetical protein
MNKWLLGFLAAGLIGVLTANEALAQRGGRGGGSRGPGGLGGAGGAPHRGPATPAGNLGLNRTPAKVTPSSKPATNPVVGSGAAARQLPTAYGWANPAHQPFTPAWYANHPNAWKATHPHADAVLAAGAIGVATWLAVPYPVAVSGTTTVVSGDTSAVSTTQPTPTTSLDPAASAANLAQLGAADPDDKAQWMDLGSLALKASGEAKATRIVQLSVNRDGLLRGSHYDLLSDQVQTIEGAIDKQTLRAAWKIGHNGKVVFQAPVDELTKPEGNVTAFFPDGSHGTWRTARLP